MKRLMLSVLGFVLLASPVESGAAIYELNWVDTSSAYFSTNPSGPWGWLDFNVYSDRVTFDVTLNEAMFNEPSLGHAIDGFAFNAPSGFVFSDHVADPLWWADNWIINSGSSNPFGTFDFGVNHMGGGIYGDTFSLELIGTTSSMEADFLQAILGPDSPSGGDFFAVHVRTQPLLNNGWFTNGPAAPVPEPGTMLLLGSGLAGLVGYGRRKFKK